MKNALKSVLTFSLMALSQGLHAQDLPTFAGCQDEDYVVVDAATASVATSGFTYTPKCLRVKVGTSVTIAGSGHHPLQAANDIEGVVNPFRVGGDGSESPQTHTLSVLGTYGYFCTNHGEITGEGMAGSIQVVSE